MSLYRNDVDLKMPKKGLVGSSRFIRPLRSPRGNKGWLRVTVFLKGLERPFLRLLQRIHGPLEVFLKGL